MSTHFINVDSIGIVFDYIPSERPVYNPIELSHPGSPAEIQVTALFFKTAAGKMVDLAAELTGGAYTALTNWAELEAWDWIKEQQRNKDED